MPRIRLATLLSALAIGLGLAAAAASPARAQDPVAETQRLAESCRDGRGDLAACVAYGLKLYNGVGTASDHAAALRIWRAACERDSGQGCSDAATVLLDSDQVPRDLPEGLRLAERGCELGNGVACFRAGVVYRDGKGVTTNPEAARRSFNLACMRQWGDGCESVGRMYADGLGIPKNELNAVASYELGCALSDMEACGLVGHMAHNGRGMTANAGVALTHYQRACAGNVDWACAALTAIRDAGPGTFGSAELAARDAAAVAIPADLPQEQRYILAMSAFHDGNFPLAVAGLQALSDEGMTEATFNLGQIYYNGQGVAQNQSKAVVYLQEAMRAGHPYAMFVMAQLYKAGHIMSESRLNAIRYMRGAAEGGVAEADEIARRWEAEEQADVAAWQARMDDRHNEQAAQHQRNLASQRQADAANMARIWGQYAERQSQRGGGQVCTTIYQGGRATQQCMTQEHFDRYYNPAYK